MISNRSGEGSPCFFCAEKAGGFCFDTYTCEGKTFDLHRCSACCAVYLHPQPSEDELAAAYQRDYYGGGKGKFSAWIEWVLDHFRRKRALKVERYIPEGASVLDIGCGNGNFLKCLIEAGYRGYGLELPGNSLERAKKVPGIKLKEGRLASGDFEPGTFDMVTLWHVFEHLNEPLKNLSIITDILKPGGYLILSLPNIESWQSRVFGKHWFHLDPPRHLFYLGPDALTAQLKAMGFKKVHQSFFSLEQNPFGMQQSILNGLLAHREVLYEALKGRSGGGKGYSGLSIALQKLFYMSTFPGFAALSVLEALFKRGGTMEMVFRKED